MAAVTRYTVQSIACEQRRLQQDAMPHGTAYEGVQPVEMSKSAEIGVILDTGLGADMHDRQPMAPLTVKRPPEGQSRRAVQHFGPLRWPALLWGIYKTDRRDRQRRNSSMERGKPGYCDRLLRSEARVALCRMQKIDLASWVGNPNCLLIN